MRSSNRSGRGFRTLLATMTIVVVGCGNAVSSGSPPPSARPVPVITPDPHLTEPATADAVFNAIRVGKLPLSVNNASAGDTTSPIVKRINADIGNWPLIISQYRSSDVLRTTLKWDPTKPAAQGSAPYVFVGLNIVIEFGPTTGKLQTPDANRQEQAERLVALVDPLLWPLEQRSVAPLPTKTAIPPSAAPATPKPKKTPKP